MTQHRGFTLIEVLIALAIVGILVGIAVPAWSGARAAVHAGSARAALLDSLLVATRHSTLAATRVVLCASRDGRECSGDPDWSGGWLVFADPDGDREHDGSETLLRRQPALAGSARLRSTSGRTRLVFQRHGGNPGSNVTFTLCDGRGMESAIALVLGNGGRLRSAIPDPAAASDCVRSLH